MDGGRRGGLSKTFPTPLQAQKSSTGLSSSTTEPIYDAIKDSLESSSEQYSSAISKLGESLKALLPEDPAVITDNGKVIKAGAGGRSQSEGGVPVAVKMALRDLQAAHDQFDKEDRAIALLAAQQLRDHADAEAASARQIEEKATDAEYERRRVADMSKRLTAADQSIDLLRNAVARRDALLAEQRTSFYRDLLQYKTERQAASMPPPAPTYEKALEGGPVEERPSFFDACVFETRNHGLASRLLPRLLSHHNTHHHSQVRVRDPPPRPRHADCGEDSGGAQVGGGGAARRAGEGAHRDRARTAGGRGREAHLEGGESGPRACTHARTHTRTHARTRAQRTSHIAHRAHTPTRTSTHIAHVRSLRASASAGGHQVQVEMRQKPSCPHLRFKSLLFTDAGGDAQEDGADGGECHQGCAGGHRRSHG
jgi:hypothetical protein